MQEPCDEHVTPTAYHVVINPLTKLLLFYRSLVMNTFQDKRTKDMHLLIRLILLLSCLQTSSCGNAGYFCNRNELSTLEQLIVVFRHGDRTPEDVFPTDIHKEDAWPQGYGQLTPKGVVRSLELGQWTRRCYNKHLQRTLESSKVKIRSSNYDRTIMSAKAHLAGAYPNTIDLDFPMEISPIAFDYLMRGHKNCPRFQELGREIDNSPDTKTIVKNDAVFFNLINDKSGLNLSNPLVGFLHLKKTSLTFISSSSFSIL